MGARTKLNVAYLNGSLIVAAVLGVCCDSLTAFCLVAGIMIAIQTVAGGIRPGA